MPRYIFCGDGQDETVHEVTSEIGQIHATVVRRVLRIPSKSSGGTVVAYSLAQARADFKQ